MVARPELADHLASGALTIDSPDRLREVARECAMRWHSEAVAALDAVRSS